MENQKIEELIKKARIAQQQIADYSQEQVDAMVRAVTKKCWQEKERLAQICVDDTGKGTYDFKLDKLRNTITSVYMYLYGRKSVGLIDYNEKKKLWTYAKPVGVIACIAPVTNPSATPIGNGLNIFKTRNAMIVSPHPGAKGASGETVKVIRQALRENGDPEDLCQMVPDGTMKDAADLMSAVDLIVATGGPGMVKAAHSSGKPALGVGQGNVQCILDDYEDIDYMVENIFNSRMVDFGMTCTGEQTVHCPVGRLNELVEAYRKRNCYYIDDPAIIQQIRSVLFINGSINRDVVGQRANQVAKVCGIEVPENTNIILLRVDKCGTDDVLAKEILCPITRIFTYEKIEDAIERARTNLLMEGAGHSSCIWSNNKDHIRQAALRMPSGRLMVNQPATFGSGRQSNGLPQSVSLGCGYWGGNSTYHNVNFKDMINYTIVSENLGGRVLTPEEIMAELCS